MFDRSLDAAHEALTDDRPHRPAHEREILDPDDCASAADRAFGGHQRIALPRCGPRGFQAVGIALGVLKLERILADFDAAYGLRSIVLRYFNAAGADPAGAIGEWHEPETHLIPIALQTASGLRPSVDVYGTDYPTPDGTCIRDYIHVTDLAQAHLLGLKRLQAGLASDVFNLGNGNGFSVREVIDTAARVTGRRVPWSAAPRRPGDPHALVGSAEKARRVLGWAPRFPTLEAIVATAWRWHSRRA